MRDTIGWRGGPIAKVRYDMIWTKHWNLYVGAPTWTVGATISRTVGITD